MAAAVSSSEAQGVLRVSPGAQNGFNRVVDGPSAIECTDKGKRRAIGQGHSDVAHLNTAAVR